MNGLIIVDMQNDFIEGSLAADGGRDIIEYVGEQIQEAFLRGEKVYFTKDTHGSDYLETSEGKKLPVVHCVKESKGWNLHSSILDVLKDMQEGKDYCILEKPTFASLDLVEELKDYSNIKMMGICTDICVVSNAILLKSNYPDMNIVVDSNGCAGVTKEAHLAALMTMEACQIEIQR